VWPVLLVEDDDADAFLVSELLVEVDAPVRLIRAYSVADALAGIDGVQCVLLDLGLPDSEGLSGLRTLLLARPDCAVVVLTGLLDEYRGDEAVAAGAQDYLVKGHVDGRGLMRAIRYAVERQRADEAALALRESQLWAQERARLERGLLPRPLVLDRSLTQLSRYRPGHRQALLGGDFYDMVQTPDGVVNVLIGDVCGHGPDEAALGASLRIAWRTLVLAGVSETLRLGHLQDVLVSEREHEELFATACTLAIDPDRGGASMRLAGHPPPALVRPVVRELPGREVGPALGVVDDGEYPVNRVELPTGWALLLVTDGLLEGRDGPGGERLGWERVLPEIADLQTRHSPDSLLDALVDWVEARNGGPLTDDVALLMIMHGAV
jgi:serine phosphatase RsbU (regulator of sigma subunit)